MYVMCIVRFDVGTLLVIATWLKPITDWTLPTYSATTATQLNACPKEVLDNNQRTTDTVAVSFTETGPT